MSVIQEVRLSRLEIPLRVPYKLAFGLVRHFDTLLVELVDTDGRSGYGEATILNGYTDETIEGSAAMLRQLAAELPGHEASALEALLAPSLQAFPFTVTALVTAAEMLHTPGMFRVERPVSVPILGVINGQTDEAVAREVDALIERGHRTLKVKVGFDVAADLAQVTRVRRAVSGRARIRIDGNQGYDLDQALRFLDALDPESIELFEQPCEATDWVSAVEVSRVSPVPMMLDESIYGLDDIRRAADFECAQFVKLKLMKMGSMRRLNEGLDLIRELGMTPVLGNGVASDIGCWMESIAAVSRVSTAGEMNGFLKPVASVLVHGLVMEGGAIVLSPDDMPSLDQEAIERFAVDRVVIAMN